MAQNPNAVRAGQVSLKVITDVPDNVQLQEVLNHVAKNPVAVANGAITLDESDLDAVRGILAEIGIEVSEPQALAAQDPDAANPPAGAAAPAANSAAAAASHLRATDDSTTDDQLYDQAEQSVNEAGDAVTATLVASASDRHWLVIAAGMPVARISLGAQPKPAQVAGFFSKPDYWNTVAAAFQKNGVAATLKALKAEVFTAKAVKAAAGPDLGAIAAAAVEKYRKALTMAFQAAQRNMIPNRLKAAAFEVCDGAGVQDPEAVVEAMFAASNDFLADLDNQACEYLSMDDSAQNATAAMLSKMSVQAAGGRVVAPKSASAAAMVASLVAGNMPLTTAGFTAADPAQQDDPNADPAEGDTQLTSGIKRSQIRASLSLAR